MTGQNQSISSRKIAGFMVTGHNLKDSVSLPILYSRPVIPHNRSHFPTREFCDKFKHLKKVSSKINLFPDIDVGLLIGFNCSKATCPLEVIVGRSSDPYAVRTPLGWSVVGSQGTSGPQAITHRIICSEHTSIASTTTAKEIDGREVLKVLEKDFTDIEETPGLSQEDKRFMEITGQKKQLDDGRYEIPMPIKQESLVELECNISLAEQRLNYLKKKMNNDQEYREHYTAFMKENEDLGFCEAVPPDEVNKFGWYIPHHGVYHRVKKKIRVVFDCSAKFGGKSLNDCLLTGPDLINSLVGVLLRFRKERVAFQADIKKMFPQFSIPKEQRDLVRYLWWKNGDTTTTPTVMRMTRHVFGAVSSMGCANVGIRAIAEDYQEKYGRDCGEVVRNSFYVDDCLHSVATPETAIDLISRLCLMFSEGRVELAKFVSSSSEVLSSIDQTLVAEKAKVNFADTLIERALGVVWNVSSDVFTYDVSIDLSGSVTRRKILSIVSSVFDPLGLVSPYILIGKRILQDLCVSGIGWDDGVAPELESRFKKWMQKLSSLQMINIARCYKSPQMKDFQVEIHTFCDGSSVGYGACSYLRLVPTHDSAEVKLVFAKSRVAPVKPMTIPRLELCAAVLAVRISLMIDKELQYSDVRHFYYTDSKVVLGYINNSTKRFHVFVANRVGFIQSHTRSSQWNHIDGKNNPADVASRGAFPEHLVIATDWFEGPSFLQDPGCTKEENHEEFTLNENDEEVKQANVLATTKASTFYKDRLAKFSSFEKLVGVIACIFKWLRSVRGSKSSGVSAEDRYKAKISIVRIIQRENFENVYHSVSSNSFSSKDPLKKFNLFIDSDGLIRVGGRLARSKENPELKYPILLPKESFFSRIVVRYCHGLVHHQGRGITLNCLRQSGFFIVGGSKLVKSVIHSCVQCKRLRGSVGVQKMANLPDDRVSRANPFDFCGMDFFGPFFVKCRRSTVKYYGCIFTCLYSRGVHVEVCHSLSSDSFIMALRRFISIRGPVKRLRCDRGTNFVGASNELKQEMACMDNGKVRDFLLANDADIEFVFNPPHASHFGGIFERQIGSIRRVFEGILVEFGSQLNPESLITFLQESVAIVNGRPLSCININDEQMEPLTPNHLLTGKSRVIVSPPGSFVKDDMYLIKHWRRVQYLANLFWTRWRSEYLDLQHRRTKWCTASPNIAVNDVVILVDEVLPRNQWKLARVMAVNVSTDGLVLSKSTSEDSNGV